MADEKLNIAVSESGTLDVIQLLQTLGLTAEDAATRVARGWVNTSQASSVAANNIKILAAASQTGITNIKDLANALDRLKTSELESAAGTRRLADFQKQLSDAYGTTAKMAAEAAAAEAKLGQVAEQTALAVARAAVRNVRPPEASSFAGGGPQGAATSATSFTDRANAATGQLAGFQAMAGGIGAAEQALGKLHVANVTATGSLNGMVASARSATSMFSGLASAVGIYVTASAAMKASDEYTLIANQLHIATTNAKDFDDQYKTLMATANASQTDIEAVVKLFARMQATTKGTQLSLHDLDQAVLGMAMGLRLSGTSASETTRLMRELSEALAIGELKGRQLQSMLANSPIFMEQLGNAMGVDLFEGMTKAGKATTDYHAKLTALQAAHASTVGSSKSLESQIAHETATAAKSTAGWLAGTVSNQKYIAVQQAQGAAIAKNTGLLGQAKAAEDAHYQSQVDAINAHIRNSESLDKMTFSTENIVNGLIKMGVTTNGLTLEQTTFGGALTVLHNQFVNLFRDGTDTNNWMTTLKGVILTVANNLEHIIPIVAAVGVAFVAMKVVTLAADFAEAAISMGNFVRQCLLFLATPTGLALLVVAAGIALVIDKTGSWGVIQDKIKNIVVSGNKQIQDTLKDVTGAYDQVTGAANKTAEAANKANLEMGKLLGLTPDNNHLNYLLTGGANDLKRATPTATPQDQADYYKANNTNNDTGQPAYRSGGMYVAGGTGVDSVPVRMMVSPGETVMVMTPSQAAGHVPVPHNDNGTHYASGGFWSPGTGFGASLGTGLSQAAITGGSVTGYTPAPMPNSGASTGTGVLPGNSLGGGNALGTASGGGVDTADVVGWSTLTMASSRAAAIAAGVGAIKEIFDKNFTDYGKAVEQLDQNFLIPSGKYAGALFDSNNNQIMGNSLLLSDPVRNIALNYAILNSLGQAAFPQSSAVSGTGTGAGTGSLASGYALPDNPTPTQIWANQAALRGDFATAALWANANNTYSWGSPPPMGYDKFGNAIFPGTAMAFAPGGATAKISGSTWNGIVPTPTFGGINTTTMAGYNAGILGYSDMVGGHSTPGPQLVTEGGAALTGKTDYKPLGSGKSGSGSTPGTYAYNSNPQIEQLHPHGFKADGTPLNTAYYNGSDPVSGHSDVPNGYRNGGDIYVPGGSGVDSQMMHLAVSPGETVHIRTPSQRAANGNMGGQVNHFTTIVHAKDVDSFGQSQAQFTAGQMRMARRVARRVA